MSLIYFLKSIEHKQIKIGTTLSYILMVEDSATDAELTTIALRNAHVTNEVVVCETGEDALVYLERADELPVLLLVDLKLPLMSGVVLIHTVRSNERTARIPVVILSGRADDYEIYAVLEPAACLVKPLNVAALFAALDGNGVKLQIVGSES